MSARSAILGLVSIALAALIAVAPAAAQELDPPGQFDPRTTTTSDTPGKGATGPGGSVDTPANPTVEPETIEELLAVEARSGWVLPAALEDEVFTHLFLEIALLRELDAFAGQNPPEINEIHRSYGPWPQVPREHLIGLLTTTDDDLAALAQQVNTLIGPAPRLTIALAALTPSQRARLARGDVAFLPSIPYMQALGELLSAGTSEELAERGLQGAELQAWLTGTVEHAADPRALEALEAENRALQAQLDQLARPGPVPPPLQGDERPWTLIAALAAGSAVLTTLLAGLATRRRRSTQTPDAATYEILEAHRRLTGVVDERTIAEIGCGTAVEITGAHDALVFRREPDGLRAAGESVVVVNSCLDHIVETAQPLRAIVDDDPAVGGPAAICAVPIVTDATASAVLVVRSGPDHPFDEEDVRRLELLAPALAGALLSADTLDSYEHMAMVDGLTSLGNRRRLDGDLEAALADATASRAPVAFAMIDIDHFKQFNDTHGHGAGDLALQSVARIIESVVRSGDVVYRYGGEEFSVLLPGATAAEASRTAERIRRAVDTAEIPGEETQPGGRLTVSVGVGTLDGGDATTLKRRADEALYEAKSRGRNCSVTS